MNTVEMAHGSGGQAMQQLINRLFMEAFNNPWLAEQEDQARIDLAALTAHERVEPLRKLVEVPRQIDDFARRDPDWRGGGKHGEFGGGSQEE